MRVVGAQFSCPMSTPQCQLLQACRAGDLTAAQESAQAGADILDDDAVAVGVACLNGHLHVAQWMAAQHGVDVHVSERALRLACCYGHLHVAQWLLAQGGVDIHACTDYAFRSVCSNGHVHVARWLVRQDPQYKGWPAEAMACLRTWSSARAGWMRSVWAGVFVRV